MFFSLKNCCAGLVMMGWMAGLAALSGASADLPASGKPPAEVPASSARRARPVLSARKPTARKPPIKSTDQPDAKKSVLPGPASSSGGKISGGKNSAGKSIEELTTLVRKSVVVVSFAGRDGRTEGLGSGFIISSDGLIATNMHVIGEARPIFVQMANGKKYDVQVVYATDRRMDLAVLKIDARQLPALPLGDSDTLRQGEEVVALGNPQGLQFSVVSGIVSGRRTIDGKPMLQLAMPIERGNSGGPLLDRQGRVHGILTLKSLVTRNLGFAVCINALKPLLQKPNPIPMSRWLTIGVLDRRNWTTLYGARWRQRAGRIQVQGRGFGFGGRSLALWKGSLPKVPFEVAVQVRMEDEDGAAGLVFHADGKDRHYGFYPSNGKMRLSRFEGPDVFSWKVLQQVESRHYRPGEWNTLKVRLSAEKLQCYVNDQLVIESTDTTFTSGQVGLAKFRETIAEFRNFRVAKRLPPSEPSPQTIRTVTGLVQQIPVDRPPALPLVRQLQPHEKAGLILQRRARQLEQQAQRLRQLARLVHEHRTRQQLAEAFRRGEGNADLLYAALLISRQDNPEVDVEAYLKEVNRMVAEVSSRLKPDAGESEKLKVLDRYLFDEMGFHGSRTNYYSRSNSYLNEVIDDREGLPITLSILYMEMARRLGLKVVGIGLPGHFIVRFEPRKGPPQLIDPFERGKRLTRREAAEKAESITGRKFDEEFLRAQTKREILVRMLRNLMGRARDDNDPEAMLRYVETVLVLQPDSGLDVWYRAVLNFQTGRLREALDDTNRVLQLKPPEVELPRVRQLQRILEDALQRSGT